MPKPKTTPGRIVRRKKRLRRRERKRTKELMFAMNRAVLGDETNIYVHSMRV